MKQSLPMLTLLAIMASPAISAQQSANSAAEPAAATATAEPAATTENAATETEADLAIKAAEAVMQHGPAEIKVQQQVTLVMPGGFGYVPKQ